MTQPVPAPVVAAPEPTHGCVRCGAPVPIGDAMCDRCNPLGLRQPAASQAHGTIFAGIGVAVVGLWLLATFALSGVGPFDGRIVAIAPDPPGLSVTLTVVNEGTRAGSTTCRVYDPSLGLGPETAYIQTPRIDPGGEVTFSRRITELGTTERDLVVACRDL